MTYCELGRRLKRLTITDLAKRANVARGTVIAIESRHPVRRANLVAVALAIGLPPESLSANVVLDFPVQLTQEQVRSL